MKILINNGSIVNRQQDNQNHRLLARIFYKEIDISTEWRFGQYKVKACLLQFYFLIFYRDMYDEAHPGKGIKQSLALLLFSMDDEYTF